MAPAHVLPANIRYSGVDGVFAEVMRRVLVLGGTGWLGREIASAALSDDTEVVCLARGDSGNPPEGVRFIRADRTAPDAFAEADGEWDEVIELAYEPTVVEPALDALADRARHWTLVSTVSVYLRNDEPGADESAQLVEPDDLTRYADAKVAAERATAARLGDRLLIARPGLIVGPGDPSGRFGYWPARLHRGGQVLTPTTANRFVQVIDVNDLATWIVRAGHAGATGAVNAVGNSHPLKDFLAEAGVACGFDGVFVEVEDSGLLERDVHYWSGPRSIPLWLPLEDVGFAQRSNALFLAEGGVLQPLRQTVARVLHDEVAAGTDHSRSTGLTPEEEQTLLGEVRR